MQNNTECNIFIWDKLVGKMTLVKDKIYFRYDKNFTLEISPISLPTGSVQYEFNNLKFQNSIHGVFSDSLPDSFGEKIINNYFLSRDAGFKPNTIDKLLFIGDVSLGALRYEPIAQSGDMKNISIELKDAKEYKKSLFEQNNYNSIRVAADMYKSFSPAGGAKQKMLLSYSEKDNMFYIGTARDGDKKLIVKIDESDKPEEILDSRIEYIYSLAAKRCGINIPQTYLFEDELGFSHFAVERFDIDKNNERLHVHTLSGLLNLEKSTCIDYTKFIEIAKLHLFVEDRDVEEIYRRMVFNFVYNNNDDHLKNHSFLMDKSGSWSLSPAYDLIYNCTAYQNDMYMSINNKRSGQVSFDDFKKIGEKYGVKSYLDILREINESTQYFCELVDKYIPENRKIDSIVLKNTKKVFECSQEKEKHEIAAINETMSDDEREDAVRALADGDSGLKLG